MEFLSSSGILSGVVAGVVAAMVQILIVYLKHFITTKDKRVERKNNLVDRQIEEIEKIIIDVSSIRIPSLTEIDEDSIENAYYLLTANFERAKSFLYRKDDCIKIRGYFGRLNTYYNHMQYIKVLGSEEELQLVKAKRAVINEVKICKEKLLKELQNKKSDLMSDISLE